MHLRGRCHVSDEINPAATRKIIDDGSDDRVMFPSSLTCRPDHSPNETP